MATAKKAVPAAKQPASKKAPAASPAAKKASKADAPKFVAPKTIGAVVDRCYSLRADRLDLTRKADAFKAEEGFLRELLIEKIPKEDTTGVSGKLARVTIETQVIPVAQDWPKIYAFIVDEYLKHKKRKTGQENAAFALLNKALSAAAVKELWDAKVAVPGVGKFNAKTLSFNKV